MLVLRFLYYFVTRKEDAHRYNYKPLAGLLCYFCNCRLPASTLSDILERGFKLYRRVV